MPLSTPIPTASTRYVLVTSHYAPLYRFGGPVRLAAQYAEAAAGAGVTPAVLTIASRAELDAAAAAGATPASVDPPAEVLRLMLDRRSRTACLLAVPHALWRFWRVTRGARRIVLHLCEYRAPLTLGAVLALRLRRVAGRVRGRPMDVRVVHSAFGQLQPPDGVGKRVFDALHRALTRRLPYTVLAQNDHEAALARRFFAAHRALEVVLLPLTTAGDPACPPADEPGDLARHRCEARAALGLAPDDEVLIFLGRWVPAKGIERLMRAVAALPPSSRPLLIVAGADFGIGESLRTLARELGRETRTRFVSDVSEDRFELYAASDVFVAAPVLFEETMLASVEALSVGTPIVVSREADIPYVERAGAGAVIDFSDAGFARALAPVLAERAAHSARARAVYEAHFDPRNLRRTIVELLEAG